MVDKSGLPGKFKAWIYQHGILPHLLWTLLIYEVPITIVEGFERKISQFLHRWLDLPQSLSNNALFGHNTKLQLPFRESDRGVQGHPSQRSPALLLTPRSPQQV